MVMNEPWLRGQGERCVDGPQGRGVYTLFVNNLMISNTK